MDTRFDDDHGGEQGGAGDRRPDQGTGPDATEPTQVQAPAGMVRVEVDSDTLSGRSPGLYVSELVSTAGSAIEPAPLGVTAIIGHSRIGPLDQPVGCHSESEANQHFGDFEDAGVLAAAIHGFFQNGGRRCYVLNLGETPRTIRPGDLEPLRQVRDIELVCAPGKTDAQDYQALLSHTSQMGTQLALLDGPRDLARHLLSLHPPSMGPGAFYVPWLKLHDPARRTVVAVPPSGHMAGLMTQVAYERGVHKAPANEPLKGLIELDYEIDKGVQDILHPRRINCIRRLPRLQGFRPWGAQTLLAQAPFDSIPAFRVYSYVVRSFETGCSWLAGTMSEPEVWARLASAGADFLTRVWRSGALAGATPEQAFRLRCDETNNDLGRPDSGVIAIEIGLALTAPGHFHTFLVELDTTGFDP